MYANKRAGGIHPLSGYYTITLYGRNFPASRVAWALYHGEMPESIDHINRIRSDDRIVNLRASTQKQNCANRPAQSNSKSGLKGAYFHKVTNKWAASIGGGGSSRHLGLFETKEEAHEAYVKESRKLYGEFSGV